MSDGFVWYRLGGVFHNLCGARRAGAGVSPGEDGRAQLNSVTLYLAAGEPLCIPAEHWPAVAEAIGLPEHPERIDDCPDGLVCIPTEPPAPQLIPEPAAEPDAPAPTKTKPGRAPSANRR